MPVMFLTMRKLNTKINNGNKPNIYFSMCAGSRSGRLWEELEGTGDTGQINCFLVYYLSLYKIIFFETLFSWRFLFQVVSLNMSKIGSVRIKKVARIFLLFWSTISFEIRDTNNMLVSTFIINFMTNIKSST